MSGVKEQTVLDEYAYSPRIEMAGEIAHLREVLRRLRAGEEVPIPQSRKHAAAMVQIGRAYIDGQESSDG